ncbi:DUF262 domain-containing protein [Aliidiomarina indica]|uniref:DUF262 domain-containing protein n=1 Tax=Aliidiomarina indica TaxID=2749147 RepID=UPI00188F7B50|nr:DUF262 domain-containing protein [Aliidiomarina indica]
MTKILGTNLVPFKDVIENHCFRIPDYQRGYAWEKEHVDAMLEDIEHMLDYRPEHEHFTGTIVLSPQRGKTEIYDIVDGQQRLTTLIIILAGIRDNMSETEARKFQTKYLIRGPLGNEYPVLTLNSACNEFFDQCILRVVNGNDVKQTLESHRRIDDAKRTVSAWLAKVDNQQVLDIILNKLGFIVYAPTSKAEVGVMFEVINNRGKPLSELEKVKNYLIYCCAKVGAEETRLLIDNKWSGILANLNNANKTTGAEESSFLRYCSTVILRLTKESSQHTYDELKKLYDVREAIKDDNAKEKLITNIDTFTRFLANAASVYAEIYSGEVKSSPNQDVALKREQFILIRSQPRQASIMPLCLAVLTKPNQTSRTQLNLLKLLEILNFRVYGARGVVSRHDTGQAELFNLAAEYYHGAISEPKLVDRLIGFVEYHSPEGQFKKSFELDSDESFDFYHWNSLKYFLINYEGYLNPNRTIDIKSILSKRKEGKTLDYLSVEHIWSTKFRQDENDRVVDNHERRRLGNYMLLELRINIQVKDCSLEEKYKAYLSGVKRGEVSEQPSQLSQVKHTAVKAEEILLSLKGVTRSKDKYYLEQYRRLNNFREKELQEFALKRWDLSAFK